MLISLKKSWFKEQNFVKDTWLSKGKPLFKHNITAIVVLGSLLTPSPRIIKTLCFFKKKDEWGKGHHQCSIVHKFVGYEGFGIVEAFDALMCAIAKNFEVNLFGEETWGGDFVGAKHILVVVFYALPLPPPTPFSLNPPTFF
jgi:hypothetical protein